MALLINWSTFFSSPLLLGTNTPFWDLFLHQLPLFGALIGTNYLFCLGTLFSTNYPFWHQLPLLEPFWHQLPFSGAYFGTSYPFWGLFWHQLPFFGHQLHLLTFLQLQMSSEPAAVTYSSLTFNIACTLHSRSSTDDLFFFNCTASTFQLVLICEPGTVLQKIKLATTWMNMPDWDIGWTVGHWWSWAQIPI